MRTTLTTSETLTTGIFDEKEIRAPLKSVILTSVCDTFKVLLPEISHSLSVLPHSVATIFISRDSLIIPVRSSFVLLGKL